MDSTNHTPAGIQYALGYTPPTNSLSALTNILNFIPATNGGPIAMAQLPYTPATNGFIGVKACPRLPARHQSAGLDHHQHRVRRPNTTNTLYITNSAIPAHEHP